MLATALCFNVGLASSLVTGGLEPMRAAFHVSEEVINLQVCLFVVGFGRTYTSTFTLYATC